jgi:hypothetical protein
VQLDVKFVPRVGHARQRFSQFTAIDDRLHSPSALRHPTVCAVGISLFESSIDEFEEPCRTRCDDYEPEEQTAKR